VANDPAGGLMKKMIFRYLSPGDRFWMNGILYAKINQKKRHNAAKVNCYRQVVGFLSVDKDAIVELWETNAADIERTGHVVYSGAE
jgi:hypothetical protein